MLITLRNPGVVKIDIILNNVKVEIVYCNQFTLLNGDFWYSLLFPKKTKVLVLETF